MELIGQGLNNLGAGAAIGFAATGGAIGIGLATMGALQAMGRNPEMLDDLRTYMILGIALAEGIAIFGLVISLVLLFLRPGMTL
ncbi:MAG: ATP synthase F0 subunit C [Anaerolineales bacterium]|nr:ATP synthase F0 subunit C [Anaerolineales bacterium]MCB9171353.1 ATP synthase F0 subunit C [Ardenticatenales bacterium]